MTVRAHPLMIAKYLRKYAALLLLPPIRSAVTLAVSGYLPTFWSGEIAVAAALIGGCVLKWLRVRLTLEGDTLALRDGLIFRRIKYMSAADTVTVNLTANPPAALLGARRVSVYAEHRKPLCDLYLSKPNAERLTAELGFDDCGYVNRFSPLQLLIAAVADSSIISGIILAYTAYSRVKQVTAISAEPYLNEAVGVIEGYLPRAVSLAAILLLIGYSTALILSVTRLALLRIKLSDRSVKVGSGIFTRRTSYIFTRKIASTSVKATIIMRLFGRCSLSVGAAGFGKERGQSKVILPAVHYRSNGNDAALTPSKSADRRAYLAPSIWLAVMLIGAAIIAALFPPIRFTAAVIATALLVYLAAYVYARIDVQRHGRLSVGRQIKVKSRSGTAAVETAVDLDNVSAVAQISGPFDRRIGVCTVKVCPAVGGQTAKIKNIDGGQCRKKFENLIFSHLLLLSEMVE